MKLSLFDLHCDTPYMMYKTKQPLTQNGLAVSLENTRKFEHYVQVMALWTDQMLTNTDGWNMALAMLQNLRNDNAIVNQNVHIATGFQNTIDTSPTILLSVEDARILDEKLERVDTLFCLGVRILTPLWKGSTCIGGSHDTAYGLTEFGRKVIRRATELGMIADISHASEASADEIFEIATSQNRPIIASHSNSYTVCPVSRNLRDRQVEQIMQTDGVIGLNLHVGFLRTDRRAFAADLLPHIDRFLELGAQDALCLGCDMDGCDLPYDIPTAKELPLLAELMLRHGYSETLIRKIFYENAARFAQTYLK